MRAQAHGQIAVKLNHGELAEPLNERLRQRGQTGADFNHRLAGFGRNGVHDGVNDASVCQKMLAKAFAWNVFDVFHRLDQVGGSRISI